MRQTFRALLTLGALAAVCIPLVRFAPVALAGEPAWAAAAQAGGDARRDGLEVATFAAGCFWCVESDFDKVDGVVETVSGFAGGHTTKPTYEEVSRGGTGHTEALQVTFDPKVVSYPSLLDFYWRHVDLLDGEGQFCDRGDQYRPAIFTHSAEQQRLALESRARLNESGRFKAPIAVEITDAGAFTPAEEYHQDYYRKNPIRYKFYRYNCGRDQRLSELWGGSESGNRSGS